MRKPPSLPPPPPPKPKPAPKAPDKELAEVERAISLLDGRHPEHERMRRETAAAAEARRRALTTELSAKARARRRRIVVGIAALAAATAVGLFAWKYYERTSALRAGIARAAAPFVDQGFAVVASNELMARSGLEADVPGVSCFAAVSDAPTVRVGAGAARAEAAGSVMWCSCAPDHVAIEAVGGERPALALLRIDARAMGGPLARPWSAAVPGTWAGGGAECADEMVDGWISAGRWPRPPLDDSWLDGVPARAPLRRAGFHVVSAVAADKPFAVVEGGADACMLAIAGTPADALSLRPPGAAAVVSGARGIVGWCDPGGGKMIVLRSGGSTVTVLAAPGPRIGGLRGLREVAAAARFDPSPDQLWLRDGDLSWDAASLLRASGVPDVAADSVPAIPGAKVEARVVASSVAPGGALARDPPDAIVACDSPVGVREQVCAPAPSTAIAWWRKNDAPAAIARGTFPFWLTFFETRHEPDALARVPELLELARRLEREGFEPTLFEGVTELADGVRVVGRGGEDAAVAVGLAPKPPWVFPYTAAVPWDLGDDPYVAKVKPGEGVKLVTSPRQSVPTGQRRTVVFRHAARP